MKLYVMVGDSDKRESCEDLQELALHLVGEGFDESFCIRNGGIASDETGTLFASIYWGNGIFYNDLSEAEYEELRHLMDEVVFDDITVLEE